jgi:3-deoxy-D-manno-octulosonate 8-phosphate phosphatase (KDO 8-P phosphatase)
MPAQAASRRRSAAARARVLRLMIFDVDGVMTDGRLWYGPRGEELKSFNALDGHGIKLLAASGVATAILSGRRSRALALRAADLGIAHVLSGVEDKRAGLARLLARSKLAAGEAGYMGDDVVDLPVMRSCGFACSPPGAHALVRRHSHYVSSARAGEGAVREVCEFVMRAQGTLASALAPWLEC